MDDPTTLTDPVEDTFDSSDEDAAAEAELESERVHDYFRELLDQAESTLANAYIQIEGEAIDAYVDINIDDGMLEHLDSIETYTEHLRALLSSLSR